MSPTLFLFALAAVATLVGLVAVLRAPGESPRSSRWLLIGTSIALALALLLAFRLIEEGLL
ncbi:MULTISPECIES: hypothetical protein [unclassified Sphingosinithalassobacter]|uniref:hypothetical protein n=1 Tax=unclassified Sphingosinithalassobacter TaxID=2676235 RepID=UPI00165E93F0|nr:hypothetical protein [Sphingosinithalassobacter sp. CS137]